MREIQFHDDDADAFDAMLRHLYNFRMKPPTPSLDTLDKVRYYCNVVVVSDKYGLPLLSEEARRGLATFVTSLEDPTSLLMSLTVLTNEYPAYVSLAESATTLARPRLPEPALVTGFPAWLTSQPVLLQELVGDATKFRNMKVKRMYRCAFCQNTLLARAGDMQPSCCRNLAGNAGHVFLVN